MSVTRTRKPVLVILAVAVLAVVLSACASFKEGSLSASQPGETGPVRLHFELCTTSFPEPDCRANSEGGQSQYLLGIAVPQGSTAPATITAQPLGEGAPIVYTRNDEVAQKIAEEEGSNPAEPWPPAGTEAVGYLSAVFAEEEGQLREWTVDADFGLPSGADGGSYAGPFTSFVATGWRLVDSTHGSDRPIDCTETEGTGPSTEVFSDCELQEETEVGTSDLKIQAPTASAAPGGQAVLQFGLDFASSASSLPSFHLAAGSSLPQAALNLDSSTFSPAEPDPGTGRSVPGQAKVTVNVPVTAQPGTYEVTLTATTGAGGSVSQAGKLEVAKLQSPEPPVRAKLKLGKVKLNRAKGTATLPVGVSGAGTLTVSGKAIAKVKRKAKGPKTIKVTIKAKGKAKKTLSSTGKAKVKVKIAFQPTNGAAVTKTKSITLKKKLAG